MMKPITNLIEPTKYSLHDDMLFKITEITTKKHGIVIKKKKILIQENSLDFKQLHEAVPLHSVYRFKHKKFIERFFVAWYLVRFVESYAHNKSC